MEPIESFSAGERRFARALFTALIYLLIFPLFGVAFSKTVAISIVIVVLSSFSYGTRWIERGGLALLLIGCLVWIGTIPAPRDWNVTAIEQMWPIKCGVR